jgi:uncharacterized protein YunC (DUF1805 family)
MNDILPQSVTKPMDFKNGCANGLSHRWIGGQYCAIMTPYGIVGCGIYDLQTAGEFGQAIAIAKGTPQRPLVDPEDLLDSKIVGLTPKAEQAGIRIGMLGNEAVEMMLQASK